MKEIAFYHKSSCLEAFGGYAIITIILLSIIGLIYSIIDGAPVVVFVLVLLELTVFSAPFTPIGSIKFWGVKLNGDTLILNDDKKKITIPINDIISLTDKNSNNKDELRFILKFNNNGNKLSVNFRILESQLEMRDNLDVLKAKRARIKYLNIQDIKSGKNKHNN